MSLVIITEIFLKDSTHGRVFRFPIDPHNAGFHYRARTAYNAFFNNPNKKRNYKEKEILYHSQLEVEYQISQTLLRVYSMDRPESDIINLNSVFEFFDVISFDNKTKKWK